MGTSVSHEKHGTGKVLELMVDGRTRVLFDSGTEHRYTLASMAKLSLALALTLTLPLTLTLTLTLTLPRHEPTHTMAELYLLLPAYHSPLPAYYPGTSPPLWQSSRGLTRRPTSGRG